MCDTYEKQKCAKLCDNQCPESCKKGGFIATAMGHKYSRKWDPKLNIKCVWNKRTIQESYYNAIIAKFYQISWDQMFQIRIHVVNIMAKIIFRSDILPSITRLMIWVNWILFKCIRENLFWVTTCWIEIVCLILYQKDLLRYI